MQSLILQMLQLFVYVILFLVQGAVYMSFLFSAVVFWQHIYNTSDFRRGTLYCNTQSKVTRATCLVREQW